MNTFSPEDAAAAYQRYAVPETGQIFYEAGFANFHLHPPTEVDFKNADRAPLLIVGADEDHTVPAFDAPSVECRECLVMRPAQSAHPELDPCPPG